MTISRREWLKLVSTAGAAAAVAPAVEARHPHKVELTDRGMLYDSVRCIGCRACTTACKEANKLPAETQKIEWSRIRSAHGLELQHHEHNQALQGRPESSAFIKRQCMHCADPACVSVCMAAALHKEENGVVAYKKSVCVGCRYCQIACPFDVPKFTWHSAIPVIVKCEMCRQRAEGPACCQACPRGATIAGTMEELYKEAHARIAKDADKYVQHVYGEKEAGGLHVLYLASKEVPFEKLGLPKVPDYPIPQTSETIQHTLYKGFAAPTALFVIFTAAQYLNERRRKVEEEKHKEDKP